jgi:hypothetical protein
MCNTCIRSDSLLGLFDNPVVGITSRGGQTRASPRVDLSLLTFPSVSSGHFVVQTRCENATNEPKSPNSQVAEISEFKSI